jgi:serine/threonine-protein kinase RsbW
MVLRIPINNSLTIQSTVCASEKVCKRILSELKKGGFSKEDLFAVHLALEEALSNAVRHGNKMDSSKHIKIDYTLDKDHIEINVRDEGEGFNPDDVPDPRCGENVYRIGGRGLFLIKAYMDTVDFSDDGKCLHMVRSRGSRENSENGDTES